MGPCIVERLALAQRDVGLLVAPVIAASPAGEEEVGATPAVLSHRDRLAESLIETAEHVSATSAGHGLPLVVIAEGAAVAAALRAAARCPGYFAALVLVNGRVDLADPDVSSVDTPTLLLADGWQPSLVAMNRLALGLLGATARLVVLPAHDHPPPETRDLCAMALSAMRRWLVSVPALAARPARRWTPASGLRSVAAMLRMPLGSAPEWESAGPRDHVRLLRPATW